MSDIDKALEMALAAHDGQTDKYGQPYICHPLRVAKRLNLENQKIVALLHDVIEDSSITLEDLKVEGFSDPVISAIEALSRREDETYSDYISRLAENEIAIPVKLADLEDNMTVTRMTCVGEDEVERLNRYLNAWRLLREIQEKTREVTFSAQDA